MKPARVRPSISLLTDNDVRDMLRMDNMRRHWKEFEKYYPASFRKSVDDLLREAGHKRTKRKVSGTTN